MDFVITRYCVFTTIRKIKRLLFVCFIFGCVWIIRLDLCVAFCFSKFVYLVCEFDKNRCNCFWYWKKKTLLCTCTHTHSHTHRIVDCKLCVEVYKKKHPKIGWSRSFGMCGCDLSYEFSNPLNRTGRPNLCEYVHFILQNERNNKKAKKKTQIIRWLHYIHVYVHGDISQ